MAQATNVAMHSLHSEGFYAPASQVLPAGTAPQPDPFATLSGSVLATGCMLSVLLGNGRMCKWN